MIQLQKNRLILSVIAIFMSVHGVSATEPPLITSPIPQINLDQFDAVQMEHILMTSSSFELTGQAVEELSLLLAAETIKDVQNLLDLPRENLEKVRMDKWTGSKHGFQDMKSLTESNRQQAIVKGKDPLSVDIQNHLLYCYNPYTEKRLSPDQSKIPTKSDGGPFNMENIERYYMAGGSILCDLYDKIAEFFIKPDIKSQLIEEKKLTLALRRYFKNGEDEVGISEHADYSLLTLVVSNESGLDIYSVKDDWVTVPHQPLYRFHVNIGTWTVFQMDSPLYQQGIHRVQAVPRERHTLALFLYPSFTDRIMVPIDEKIPGTGKEMTFKEYLNIALRTFEGATD